MRKKIIFRHLRCASYGFEVINDIVKHEKEYKKNRP